MLNLTDTRHLTHYLTSCGYNTAIVHEQMCETVYEQGTNVHVENPQSLLSSEPQRIKQEQTWPVQEHSQLVSHVTWGRQKTNSSILGLIHAKTSASVRMYSEVRLL